MAKKAKRNKTRKREGGSAADSPAARRSTRSEIVPAAAREARPRESAVAAAAREDRRQHGRRQRDHRQEAHGRSDRGADARSPARSRFAARRARASPPSGCAKGWTIGCKVTLRGARMYEFLDRLISLALPRVRDFRGLNPNAFDGHGNYSLGLTEQLVFPELNPDKFTARAGHEHHDLLRRAVRTTNRASCCAASACRSSAKDAAA